MSEMIEVTIPDIGDFSDVEVIEVSVQVGDSVEAEQTLAVLESDKASMDIPSTASGVVKALKIQVGDRVSEGSPVVVLETGASAAEPAVVPEPKTEQPPTEPTGATLADALVPDIGDFSDVEVIEVLIKPGDQVEAEQTLIVLESDKASMDVPTEFSGTVSEVAISVGDKVSQGSLIARLQTAGDAVMAPPASSESAAPAAESKPAPKPAAKPAPEPVVEPPRRLGGAVHATPSVRRFARELGVDLSAIEKGSGRKGRILKEDVKGFVKKALSAPASGVSGGSGIPPMPEIDFSKFGEIEEQKLSKIKRLTGVNLSRAWLNLPMVTHHDEADITEMEAFRKSLKGEAEKAGVKVTGLVFIMKALVAALKQYPQFNSSLSPDGERLIMKKFFNVGIAVDTPNGLVVPVFKDVDKKSVFELSAEMAVISAKAREGKLMPADMQGGCMTISSLGGIGGTAFTPIVNAPEVAILGVTRSSMQPVWNGEIFEPRLMVPLDLTYDHRVIDGADAARFCVALARYLGDIRRLLL